MIFSQNIKIADLIHTNYQLLKVLNRFGISLGFREKTVQEICNEYQINTGFFLEIVNAFHDPDYFPKENLQHYSVKLIIDYLKKTHLYYLDEKIPELEKMITEMEKTCYSNVANAHLLRSFFLEYKNELQDHIKREEDKVFPYSINVEETFENKKHNPELLQEMLDYSMENYRDEHDNIEEKLYDLKNIIIKYLPSPINHNLCSRVLSELFLLEQDINDHSRIEDKVLVPKVIKMEKTILKRENTHG